MAGPIKILLQTTIPFTEDDWHIGRFSHLAEYLRSLADADGRPLYDITARDRENDASGNDAVLNRLDESEFDQLWLFAVDVGDGLTADDCAGITRFHERGGGILSARDHFDLGSSICSIGGIGAAHYFHSKQPDPDDTRNQRDDNETLNIDFPNYHSGSNGNFQDVDAAPHPLMARVDGSLIEYFPAHPHEGGIGAPNERFSVVARGKSMATGRDFNLVVAMESETDGAGRAIAESSFHHFADYNWNVACGCPTFVEEAPGCECFDASQKLDDIKCYAANAARWLSKL